jgi:hypothetical protein
MIQLSLNTGKETIKWTAPQGRHEVSYDKWNEAYQHIKIADEARELLEEGNSEKATLKAIESICKTIASLSDGITYEQLMKCKWDEINNLFLVCFKWIQQERPKKDFIVDGIRLVVPDFSQATAGQFMDVMQMMEQLKEEDNDIDKGIAIAAVYCRQTPYFQDMNTLSERKEWFKKHANCDLFYSCAFFLRSFYLNCPTYSPPSLVAEAVDRLTSTLNVWVTIHYLQASRNAGLLSTRK